MVDVDVQIAETTSTEILRRRDPVRFTATYVSTNGTRRFYGRDYPTRLRRAGLVPLRFDALRGLSRIFRRVHGLKVDGRVYLAFASRRAAAAFIRAARARVSEPS
jgi:hypothetical protein